MFIRFGNLRPSFCRKPTTVHLSAAEISSRVVCTIILQDTTSPAGHIVPLFRPTSVSSVPSIFHSRISTHKSIVCFNIRIIRISSLAFRASNYVSSMLSSGGQRCIYIPHLECDQFCHHCQTLDISLRYVSSSNSQKR